MSTAPTITPVGNTRLTALDTLRGLIMVLMALDHASFFIARVHPFEYWNMGPPHYADTGWFLTRWITHLCAPGFFFLMGTGLVYFRASRLDAGWTEARITRQLMGRGALLVVVSYLFEMAVWLMPDRFSSSGLSMNPMTGGHVPILVLTVLVTLGLTMALCAPLLRLSRRSWLAMAFIAIMAPNFLVPTLRGHDEAAGALMHAFVVPGFSGPVASMYPILPWFGICALGVGFAQLLRNDSQRAMRAMLPMGLAYLVGFVGIRYGGGFGNLMRPEGGGLQSFLTVIKYPPSLAFCLLTLGINLSLLSLIHRAGAWLDPLRRLLSVYGQAPLFFYLAHLWLFCAIRLAVFRESAPDRWVLYAVWTAGLVVLYPACAWFRRLKTARPPESFLRLF
ncbi:heparan-alpha-glucosaminide N-acetyltransferase domain-containing protein [uncultured Paludibaculum sp.]|uniref:DUF1624 domain-containing protein n=1 Tax=uncultured Paludibaculum sp. TaxID=1765020 RepID=UPI002AAAF992|nr:heparan-alpha-glucosaminide N-acetyltransferase domain-containing protein [uncultured Paludibaculum sp.]